MPPNQIKSDPLKSSKAVITSQWDDGSEGLQEDLEHGLCVRDLLPTVLNHALLERFRPCGPLFALAATLDGSIRCAFTTVDLELRLVTYQIHEDTNEHT